MRALVCVCVTVYVCICITVYVCKRKCTIIYHMPPLFICPIVVRDLHTPSVAMTVLVPASARHEDAMPTGQSGAERGTAAIPSCNTAKLYIESSHHSGDEWQRIHHYWLHKAVALKLNMCY